MLLYALDLADEELRAKIESDPELVAGAEEIKKRLEEVNRINLKEVLMELGNRLVTECGYDPAIPNSGLRSTQWIANFTEWLNNMPEAREILDSMGIDWPVVEKK